MLRTSTIVDRFSLKNSFISVFIFILFLIKIIVKGLGSSYLDLLINSLEVGKSFLLSRFNYKVNRFINAFFRV